MCLLGRRRGEQSLARRMIKATGAIWSQEKFMEGAFFHPAARVEEVLFFCGACFGAN